MTIKLLKAKTKSHGNDKTYLYDKKIPNVDVNGTCLAVINLNSALKKDEKRLENLYNNKC